MSLVMSAHPNNGVLSSSPGQWCVTMPSVPRGPSVCPGRHVTAHRSCRQLLDRIEKNIEDVLNEVAPPRAQTAPPRAGVRSSARLSAPHQVINVIGYAEQY